jgi:hypothetical protein
MEVRLTRDQWFKCIVELSKARELPEIQDTIRNKLAESSAPMDAETIIVLSEGAISSVAQCAGRRIGELLNGQIGDRGVAT